MNGIPSKDHKTRTYEVDKVLTCLALMTNYISKTMDMMDQLLAIRDNIKTVIYYKKLSWGNKNIISIFLSVKL